MPCGTGSVAYAHVPSVRTRNVRNYAGFAGEEVPAGKSCSLTGILQYDDAGKGRYLLKLRNENDCMY